MNTRQPIQPADTPIVLSTSNSPSRNRFIAGLSTGLRVFRMDNCLATFETSDTNALKCGPTIGSTAIAEVLDDRYLAFVSGGKASGSSRNVVRFWDCLRDREITNFDFFEPVVGIRLSSAFMVVILHDRSVLFEFRILQDDQHDLPPTGAQAGPHDDLVPSQSPNEQRGTGDGQTAHAEINAKAIRGPNKAKAIFPTGPNAFSLACLGARLLVLPARSNGQIQLIPLAEGSKRIIPAHNSSLRRMCLSPSGSLLATTSETGTLVRVFDTQSLDKLAEFRRGMEPAITFDLAFSPGERFVACTSDKGTVHVFDLRPTPPAEPSTIPARPASGQFKPQSHASHRLSAPGMSSALDRDNFSAISGHSSVMPSAASNPVGPGYQGSVQEYYGLRPPPTSTSPQTQGPGFSAISAFRSSAFAPRFLKDVRSVASAQFHMGDEPPHWQGGPTYSWTYTPNGEKKRIKNKVAPLPGEPSGRSPKGLLSFAGETNGGGSADDRGAVLHVIAGGSDARWEEFNLVPSSGGGWVMERRGFRKYLTRQFVD